MSLIFRSNNIDVGDRVDDIEDYSQLRRGEPGKFSIPSLFTYSHLSNRYLHIMKQPFSPIVNENQHLKTAVYASSHPQHNHANLAMTMWSVM